MSVHARGARCEEIGSIGYGTSKRSYERRKSRTRVRLGWLWIGHGVAGVFRSSRSKRSRFFQGVADDEHWHLTDVQPWHLPSEAVVAVLRNGSTVSELISPADQRRVLQFPKLMASGDVLGIEGGCWSRCAQGLAAGAAGGHRRRGSCCHGSPRPQRR